jgi:hypothetical protein
MGRVMNRFAVAIVLLLALAACTSAPTPQQPVEAEQAPCVGERFSEGARNYARCIKHVATPATQNPAGSRRDA